MTISDHKVNIADFNGKDITGLPDRPSEAGMSASQLKEQFDAGAKKVVTPKYNALIEELLSTEGAKSIGVKQIDGVSGYTVQDVLSGLKTVLDTKQSIEQSNTDVNKKFDKTEAQALVKTIAFDEKTGKFTITKYDGTTQTIDTALEKVALNVRLDGQQFVLTLVDGTEQRVDLSAFLTETEVKDSSTVGLSIEQNAIIARLLAGSVKMEHLNEETTAYLEGQAQAAASSAAEAAVQAGNSLDSANAAAESQQSALACAQDACRCASDAEYTKAEVEALRDAAAGSAEKAAGSAADALDRANHATEEADRAEREADRAAGIAGGDFMIRDTYDTQKKDTDIFLYADEIGKTAQEYADQKTEAAAQETLENAKGYTDSETDAALQEMVEYTNAEVEETMQNAKSYTDEREQVLRSDFSGVAQEDTAQEILALLKEKDLKRYGVRINKNEADPNARVEYIYDAVGMKPAKMNFASGSFDYGDWGDIWFIKENYPCMLKANGEEDYRLDKNDHSKRENGAASDITNTGYNGNAMAAIPLVWIARWEEGNYEYISVCQGRYDETYHADAHTKADGGIMDKIYLAMYRGALVDTKLRSLSGQQPMYSKTAQQEIDYAKANGELWSTDSISQYNLLADLMTIISKSDDSQGAFGNGNLNYNAEATPTMGVMKSGSLDKSGQFWGANDNTHQMKAFYIEAVYADQWRRVQGIIYDHGVLKMKPIPPYNLTGEGYTSVSGHLLNAAGAAATGALNGYISKTKMTRYGRVPIQLGGSTVTYTCDYCWSNDTIVAVGLVGGTCGNDVRCGVRALSLYFAAAAAGWSFGAALACEPPSAFAERT